MSEQAGRQIWNQLCDIVGAEILKLDDYRDQVVVRGKDTHMLPVVLVEKIASGTMSIYEVEENEDLIEAMAKEWAEFVLRGIEDGEKLDG